MDLEKELQKNYKISREAAKSNEVITDFRRLLGYNGRESKIMSALAPKSVAGRANDQFGRIIELEKEENFYGGQVFEKAEIIHLAKKYRLKFLPASLFTGYIDPNIGTDIMKLENQIAESNIEERAKRENMTRQEYLKKYPEAQYKQFDDSELKNNFLILAPPSSFDLKTEAIGTITKYKIEFTDPIMFYKLPGNKYRLIRKWGNDFTIFRRILGLIYKNNVTFRTFMLALPSAIIFTIISYILFNNIPGSWWPIPAVFGLIAIPNMIWGAKFKEDAFTDGGWCESNVKYGFFMDVKEVTIRI